jgi:hypothetical protein
MKILTVRILFLSKENKFLSKEKKFLYLFLFLLSIAVLPATKSPGAFVLIFEDLNLGFVSDFDIRISDLCTFK